MERFILFACFLILYQHIQNGVCDPYKDGEIIAFLNRTTPSDRQLYDFGLEHREPIGVLTTSSGLPVEVRQVTGLNTDQLNNPFFVDFMKAILHSKVPERVIQAKGTGAWGHFQLNHDLSKYTSADIFNGAGKITPAFVRFSTAFTNTDLGRTFKGMAVKLYTKEGNLDILNINMPFFFMKDPVMTASSLAFFGRNPKTYRIDYSMMLDFMTKKSTWLTAIVYYNSDYGLPNGYRKADYFPNYTYELRNKHGDRYFVRFSFRTRQGIENLSELEAKLIEARDFDYYNRDLYDAIEEKNYPAWDLEMDVMTYDDVLRCDYDPFDVTRLWKKGTYHTVKIGCLVLNKNPENYFRDVELSAFNPGNLVPGIPGPIDSLFKATRGVYKEANTARLGINYYKIHVNLPLHRREYNRNGMPPVLENMKDAPVYYPNSFNGPIPYVEESRPKDSLYVLQSQAFDMETLANFYHHYINTELHKQRFLNNTIEYISQVAPFLQKRIIYLYTLLDPALGKRLAATLLQAEHAPGFAPPHVLIPEKKRIV